MFVGATTATTDESGNVSFTRLFNVDLVGRRLITATATDPAGSTSEFSRALQADVRPTDIIDNSDAAGFDLSGDWTPGGGPGVGRNDNLQLAFGEPEQTDTATWTFDVDGPGRYRVSATWFTNTAYSYLFSDAASFEIFDPAAGVVRGTVTVNQQVFPDDFREAGSDWEDLGVFDITGSSLVVRLTSGSDNATYVVADAVRIERVGDVPVGPVLPTRIVDDGGPGYSQTGDFQSAPLPIARDGDNSYALFEWAPSEAAWTFTVTPGQYQVSATWFNTGGSAIYASNAPFTVLDGGAPLGTFALDQRQGPDDFSDDGSSWEAIGGAFDVSGTTLTVRLTNVGADGYVLADAVRLNWLGPPADAQPAPQFAPPPDASPPPQGESFAREQAWLAGAYDSQEADQLATVLVEEGNDPAGNLAGRPVYRRAAKDRTAAVDLALNAWV